MIPLIGHDRYGVQGQPLRVERVLGFCCSELHPNFWSRVMLLGMVEHGGLEHGKTTIYDQKDNLTVGKLIAAAGLSGPNRLFF